MSKFKELIGKTLVKIELLPVNSASHYDEIVFTTTDGVMYKLFHEQSC